jgi:hypothetical protein
MILKGTVTAPFGFAIPLDRACRAETTTFANKFDGRNSHRGSMLSLVVVVFIGIGPMPKIDERVVALELKLKQLKEVQQRKEARARKGSLRHCIGDGGVCILGSGSKVEKSVSLTLRKSA